MRWRSIDICPATGRFRLYTCLLLCSAVAFPFLSCQDGSQIDKNGTPVHSPQGSFRYDLDFLNRQDSVIVLQNSQGNGELIVSPRYQGKVFTSTAQGDSGTSFGWINYPAFAAAVDSHMNAYGGENRLWLGPEGGKYSLFFTRGKSMVYPNWKTPSPFDTEAWSVTSRNSRSVTMHKDMQISNYAGTSFSLAIDRSVTILDRGQIDSLLGIPMDTSINAVGYQTVNILTNTGAHEWTAGSGMPCIWMLDMFRPSPSAVIIIPFRRGVIRQDRSESGRIATTDYFGKIPPERFVVKDSAILYRADGNSRGKLGIYPPRAKPVAGSFDADNRVLTIILFDVDPGGKYLNQEWSIGKPPFSGDAVNAYNDGPLADGTKMGPFYELESVSPAAFLQPRQAQTHHHAVFHFIGSEKDLNTISRLVLGTSLGEIKKAFPG
ncbi:MAG: hypothetical protein Q8927_10065 [Bacteroidota bacterium]|nr:hypothetical protein [Bacteroidota bacterium]MDP4216537.1 hypothetical protein [Bacteroidota bacterium]MDP4246282.1 hypothetical protein [Bacteroidota bacterium]MDP4255681.1 hypothetical protein [Bacteroidota bacterium]MDP4259885.1 hypothetical protein [Bacteroidota bacterium]